MKNVLILTYNFPPDGGPAVQRVTKFIKYINNFGYRAIVLTSKNSNEIIDNTLLEDIPDSTLIYKTVDYGNYCPGELRNKLLKNLFVPDKQRFWGVLLNNTLKRIIKEHKIDIIFSSSPPHSVHIAAMKIKNKLNIPWVVDFRDEWTKNPSFKDFIKKEKNKELEELVVRNADHIVVCTQAAEDNFKKMYAVENISVILNGYDSEDFESITNHELQITNDNGCLNILYYGRLSKLKTNINNLLQAMSELEQEEHPNYLPIKLSVIGNNLQKNWMKNFQTIENNVSFIGYKSHRECLEYSSSADILLLLATNMNDTEFFPAKIFEYVKLRKPILAIITKAGELSSFLESYGNSKIVYENDIENLKRTLLEIIDMKRNYKLKLSDNDKFIESYDRQKQAEELAKIFNKVIKND